MFTDKKATIAQSLLNLNCTTNKHFYVIRVENEQDQRVQPMRVYLGFQVITELLFLVEKQHKGWGTVFYIDWTVCVRYS